MAYTLQNIADAARQSLNDDDKERWSDAELLTYMQDGIGEMRRRRPDLFIGQYATLDVTALVIGSTFPTDAAYARPLIDYTIARAEAKDAEEASDGRAAAFMSVFKEGLS